MKMRRKMRFQTRDALPVRVFSGGKWLDGRILNVSESGAFITVGADVWTGEEVTLDLAFVLPEGHFEHKRLRAVTVWSTESKVSTDSETISGYGLLFLDEKDTSSYMSQAIQYLVDAGRLVPMNTAN